MSKASSNPLGTRRRRSTKSLFSSGIDLRRRSSTELMIDARSLSFRSAVVKIGVCFFGGDDILRIREDTDFSPFTRRAAAYLLLCPGNPLLADRSARSRAVDLQRGKPHPRARSFFR